VPGVIRESVSAPRRALLIAAFGALVVVSVIGALLLRDVAAPRSAADVPAEFTTVGVTTGDMVSATNTRAVLHYAQERALTSAPGGVVTALPAVGAVIAPGGTLYRVNNSPVVLMRGGLPAWRSFESGMPPGDDVRQLEQNLSALGVFRGDVDATFTRATADAVRAWQKSLGVERTGKIDRASILFTDHDLRVARLTAVLGAEVGAGTALYDVSATTKVVDLDLRLADQQLAAVGKEVGITLPDGANTTGSITSVGEPVEREPEDPAAEASGGAGGTFVVPVTVTLTDHAAADGFSRASVSVQFSSTLADDVLTVPVEALVAIDATKFAIETPGRSQKGAVRRIPVTVGAFASGRVQVSGEGIREGLQVVVPQS